MAPRSKFEWKPRHETWLIWAYGERKGPPEMCRHLGCTERELAAKLAELKEAGRLPHRELITEPSRLASVRRVRAAAGEARSGAAAEPSTGALSVARRRRPS